MQGYQIRRAAIVLLGVILLVFIIVQGVRWLGNAMQDESTREAEQIAQDLTLDDFLDSDSAVRLTYTGPIVAREDYQQVRMTVRANQRRIELIDGFGNNVAKSKNYSNDSEAYTNFLKALAVNGFTEPKDGSFGPDDRGVCADGRKIVGQVFDGGQELLRLWAVSCGAKVGTMDARMNDILDLFEVQFPNYRDFTRNVDF